MFRFLAAAVLVAVAYSPAVAGPTCTSEPKTAWMAESAMKAKIDALGYKTTVFKTTSGNCYEIYGFDSGGARVEVYFHPITGDIVSAYRKS
jgi:hypothetical protein